MTWHFQIPLQLLCALILCWLLPGVLNVIQDSDLDHMLFHTSVISCLQLSHLFWWLLNIKCLSWSPWGSHTLNLYPWNVLVQTLSLLFQVRFFLRNTQPLEPPDHLCVVINPIPPFSPLSPVSSVANTYCYYHGISFSFAPFSMAKSDTASTHNF